MVEHLRVDDTADGPFHLGIARELQQRTRVGAVDGDLAEARQVDQTGRLAHGAMLLANRREERHAAPAPLTLVGAHAAPRLAGLDVLGTLEAGLNAEDGTRLLQPTMERRDARRAAPLVLVVRIAQVVVVAIRLAPSRGRVLGVAVDVGEAPGSVARDVPLGLAGEDPLGQRFAHAAGAAEAVQRQTRRDPKAGHAGHWPEQRVSVGRHRVGVADQRDHAGVLEEGEAANRALHQLDEALFVGRHGAGAVLPRHAVDPARGRVGLVATKEDAARLGLAVDEVVGVAEARHIARQLMSLDGRQRDVLMIHGRGRHPRADHLADARRPHPRRVDDRLAPDAALLRADGDDFATRSAVDARYAAVLDDLHAELTRGIGQGVRRAVRVEPAVARNPDAAVERLRRRGRHLLEAGSGLEQFHVHTDAAGARHAATHLGELFW